MSADLPRLCINTRKFKMSEVKTECVENTGRLWLGHTTASCSFSSSICNSAGVMGRGCRIGTPFSKLPDVVAGLSGGNGCPPV